MKKAIKINISGIIYHIDEDAYERLKSYLKSVEAYFSSKEGGTEIIDDIESRIAELFQSRVSNQKEVITLADVNEVTAIMGDPGDFVEEAEDFNDNAENVPGEGKRIFRTGPKRLYRDPENAVFGGVCGGLGTYLGIDPVIIRILFVILLIAGYGVWGLVYIVLWIALPKAVTIAQKLEMRGEHVTIINIEKNIKQEFEDVKTRFKKFEKSEGYNQFTSAIGEIFQVLGKIIVVVAKVVLVVLGIALVFSGFILLMGFLGVFFFNTTFFSGAWFDGAFLPLNQFLSAFIDPVNLTVISVALFFSILIPLIVIIYAGIKLVFRIRSRDRGIGILALVIWIASVSVLFTLGLVEARKYVFSGSTTENVIITPPASRTLYLQLNDNVNHSSLEGLTFFPGRLSEIFIDPANKKIYARPALIIRYTTDKEPELIIERRAHGASQLYSELNTEKIDYNWELRDSILIFDSMYSVPSGVPWNFSGINLRLNLPDGHYVHLGNRMDRIITSARTRDRGSISSMTGKKWRMTEERLIQAAN
jgi:phage shock protein PspC (stress-responsive transcriptional regulator)